MRTFPDVPCLPYPAIRADIQSGDILLCSGTAIFSVMIQHMTDSLFSHVAFLLRENSIDRIMVLESVESIGVQTVPLSRYVTNYDGRAHPYPGKLWIARHTAFPASTHANLTLFSQGAVDLFGTKYDTQECLGILARIIADKVGFLPRAARSNRTFICSEYAALCYASVGIEIPYDRRGFISPKDFAECKDITILWEIAVEHSA